ncbi:MAG TPA: tRNA (N6-threonylcarbamoyladenosine(37)-N6)-methyltransferase TrmO [Polyangiaceae bacterium]
MPDTVTLTPIGVVHSPFRARVEAPRQPRAAHGVSGRVELFGGHNFEHALEDLETFRYIWLVFWFHLNHDWRPKVSPPRSTERRGVFATRSPYRPNPLGLSVLELIRVEGLVLHVANLDILDGTPVLDIKPYVPYADSMPDANSGWLGAPSDPLPSYQVAFSELAQRQLAYLLEHHALELREGLQRALSIGPEPLAYRRIRKWGDDFVIALKDWRARFASVDQTVQVLELWSGHRPQLLASSDDPALAAHRGFLATFGAPAKPPRIVPSRPARSARSR